MAKKKKAEPGEEGEGKKKGGGPKPMLLGAALVLVGVMVGSKCSGAKVAAAAPAAAATTATTLAPGPEVKLDPITLNLADGKIMKLGLTLELTGDAKLLGATTTVKDDPGAGYAKVPDLAIAVFSTKTAAEATGAGLIQAEEELATKVKEAFGGKVVEVYFTQAVVAG